uniref:Uncharacterized protein n=1 Tax=Siphoviridae sp. ct6YY1 TaxID=2825343 RepID=A0A8S5V2X0_9CAUD|nr:MAG TPA: hypothetical protein [Siphoviridae sp. ct6YY1]
MKESHATSLFVCSQTLFVLAQLKLHDCLFLRKFCLFWRYHLLFCACANMVRA